jgi:hypothetical protein
MSGSQQGVLTLSPKKYTIWLKSRYAEKLPYGEFSTGIGILPLTTGAFLIPRIE